MDGNENGAAESNSHNNTQQKKKRLDKNLTHDESRLILIGRDVMRNQVRKSNKTIKFTQENESGLDASHIKSNWVALPLATATTRHLATQDTTGNNLSQLNMIFTVLFGFSKVTGAWMEDRNRLKDLCAEGKVKYEKYTLLRGKGLGLKFVVSTSKMTPFVKAEMESTVSQKIFRLQARSAREVLLNFTQYVCGFVSTTHDQIKSALEKADFNYMALAGEIASAPPTQQPTARLNPTASGQGQQFEVETASVENGTQIVTLTGADAAELQRFRDGFAKLEVESVDDLTEELFELRRIRDYVFEQLQVKDVDELEQKFDVPKRKADAEEELERFWAKLKEAAKALPGESERSSAELDIILLKTKVMELRVEANREATFTEVLKLHNELLQTRLAEERREIKLLQTRLKEELSAARRGEFRSLGSSSKENRDGNEDDVSDGLEQGRGGAGAPADSNDLGSKRSDGGGETA